jgi:hypothetical protein
VPQFLSRKFSISKNSYLYPQFNNSRKIKTQHTISFKFFSLAILNHIEHSINPIPPGSLTIVLPPPHKKGLTTKSDMCIVIDSSKAERKIRLLTLATLSNTPSRTLSYSKIAASLEIPNEDVELWLIDIIRAGLVEGKLSQARQELLVHRSTYRTFGREEWEELDSRLEDWKVALEAVLASDQIAALREQEQQQQSPTGTVVNGTAAGHEVAT